MPASGASPQHAQLASIPLKAIRVGGDAAAAATSAADGAFRGTSAFALVVTTALAAAVPEPEGAQLGSASGPDWLGALAGPAECARRVNKKPYTEELWRVFCML